jgi:chromodomain-helicase-DNA-binding protein 7
MLWTRFKLFLILQYNFLIPESFGVTPEPITEEKANKVLERLDMFKKLRQEIVLHPNLDERLLLALDNQDLPDWWVPGKHDRDLLFGVAK